MTAVTFRPPIDTRYPHDVPTSSRYAAHVTDLATRVAIIDRLGELEAGVTGSVSAALERLGWEVRLDHRLPTGTLVYQPSAARLTVRDDGELRSLLAYAEEARHARAWLRQLVYDTAARVGLNPRLFNRPATR